MEFLMYKKLMLVSLLLVIFVSGCTSTEPFRVSYSSLCKYENSNDCSSQAIHISNPGKNNQYRLSFIEYDDQGQLQLPRAKKSVIESYRNFARDNNILLITFIHGWHHNADGDPEDVNITSFRELLEQASSNESEISALRNRPEREVLGIYIGWRGASLIGFLNYFTFWDRKSTAQEVGYQGITEVLLELEQMAKIDAKDPSNNRMITIGHSFGGAALFSSLSSVMAERYVSSRPFKTEQRAEGFGDLVLLINPAFEALRYGSLYELAQDECREYPKNQLPKLVILSSQADKAVGFAFRLGRYPSTLFESHRDTSSTYCTNDGEETYDIDQWSADVTGVGHYDPYVTHFLKVDSESESIIRDSKGLDATQAWLSQIQSQSGIVNFNGTKLISKGRTKPMNPYLNIYTTKGVMDGHNDIWTDVVKSFVNDLISISVAN